MSASLTNSLIVTADGSHTLLADAQGTEIYHSRYGALQESEHVFIRNGLNLLAGAPGKVRLLEVGFGTGLNALLAYRWTEQNHTHIEYTGLEPNPIPGDIVHLLNYPQLMGVEPINLERFHQAPSQQRISFWDYFSFKWRSESLENADLEEDYFDIIFFDAFSPRYQPDVWSVENFEKLHHALKPNGLLVTYCAKSELQRTLKQVGFDVSKLPGPPGKREMIRATCVKAY